ncbi:MAG TPA: Asp-tRNA(Asn)/Glu-tRNA(Gln) amidotransferase subunit GatC [Kiritimatiellae bacterium]|nr:Asp-tRNA(Asn)/Glu-tRNA(Gln) amidotransferase subunit GatC [Kiritimatiellia bacterium]
MGVEEKDLARRIDVGYVAGLARLELSPDEAKIFQRQLDEVLGYVRLLELAPVDDLSPSPYPGDLSNVFRKDAVRASDIRDTASANAPCWRNSLFIVPPIMDQS